MSYVYIKAMPLSIVASTCYTNIMNNLTRLIFTIAAIIVGVWLLALVFRVAAWLINGLLYVAAIVVIVGLVSAYVQSRKPKDKEHGQE